MGYENSSGANPSGMKGICPKGWHLPSDAEWKQLEMHLGMSRVEADTAKRLRGTDEGGKLKESGKTHWMQPNKGAINSSGFSAIPAGYRDLHGDLCDWGDYGYFWSTTKNSSNDAWFRGLYYNHEYIERGNGSGKYGLSVRCIRD